MDMATKERLDTYPIQDKWSEKICTNCYKTGSWTACGGCRMVYYCSKDCRKSHSSQHQWECHDPLQMFYRRYYTN